MKTIDEKENECFNEYNRKGINFLEKYNDSTILFLLCQKFFIKLNRNNTLGKEEVQYIVDYMKCGYMGECELLDYENLRMKYKNLNLPKSDF